MTATRANLAGFDVEVFEGRFEDWAPPRNGSRWSSPATAWQWADPMVGYRKAAEVLEPHGYPATWGAGHVSPHDGDPFFEELQEIYEEIGESLSPDSVLPRPQELHDDRGDIDASGLCQVIDVKQYDWETVYDAEGYIDLLNTFSGHIAMEDWQRNRLYGEICGASPNGPVVASGGTGEVSSRLRDAAGPDIPAANHRPAIGDAEPDSGGFHADDRLERQRA